MLIRRSSSSQPAPSEITPEAVYKSRRNFIKTGVAAIAASALPVGAQGFNSAQAAALKELEFAKTGRFATDEPLTSFDDVTSYNNFYEFGTGKSDPVENAGALKTDPWTIVVDGEVAKPGKIGIEDLIKPDWLEERVYRLRCVEAWSMVIPWVGLELNKLLVKFEPTSKAKYVAFETLVDPAQMPGQRRRILDWPYREGLRMDEALHPLTLLSVGLYGKVLPNQNGAPVRLVVPWKYGFKSIKSIVRITLTDKEPPTTWNMMQPSEYGFYANVNPEVDHPRWSQARERRIGAAAGGKNLFGGLFAPKRDTLMMNGYAEEVLPLYKGMDLAKFF